MQLSSREFDFDIFVAIHKQVELRFPKSMVEWKNVIIESDANVPSAFRQPWSEFLGRIKSMEDVATKAIEAEVAAKTKAKKIEALEKAKQEGTYALGVGGGKGEKGGEEAWYAYINKTLLYT